MQFDKELKDLFSHYFEEFASTWLILGLLDAECRMHAAAASIIRNISSSLKFFSSRGSINPSK